MLMRVRRLVRPVTVVGTPAFGSSRAELRLESNSHPENLGWWLKTEAGLMNINPKTVSYKGQSLAIWKQGERSADVLEHLLPLRAYGLLGLTIEAGSSLPFDGCGKAFFKAIRDDVASTVSDVRVSTVDEPCSWIYPHERGGRAAYTEILPRMDGKLSLEVTVSYKGLGEYTKRYEFPDEDLVTYLMYIQTQGWPSYRYWLSRLGSLTPWWRHHHEVVWPRQYDRSARALELFADHRALDLLGAMCLLMNGGWFSADVRSVCSGHQADIEAARIAVQSLIPVLEPAAVV